VTERERLDLNEAIRSVVTITQGELRKNRVFLTTRLASDLPAVSGDRVQMQQVVLNLMMNAIEAMSLVSDRPRELVVSTQPDGEHVRVTVRDSGAGLDPQAMGRIFDAFYTTKHSGLGMGLSISRSIVESHGGRLWAAPNDGAAGTTFHFTV
jgi:C4-dicarboxylate-specific signal transduction histidine kinase